MQVVLIAGETGCGKTTQVRLSSCCLFWRSQIFMLIKEIDIMCCGIRVCTVCMDMVLPYRFYYLQLQTVFDSNSRFVYFTCEASHVPHLLIL